MVNNEHSNHNSQRRRGFIKQAGAATVVLGGFAGCIGDDDDETEPADTDPEDTPTPDPGDDAPEEDESDFPTQPIQIIMPYSPGGGSADYFYAQQASLNESFNTNFEARFRPGAAAMIGINEAVEADPDGYTWGQWILPTNTISWYDQDQPFDPTGIEFIGGFGRAIRALVTNDRHEDLWGDPEGFIERGHEGDLGTPIQCVRSVPGVTQAEFVRENGFDDQHPPSEMVDAYDCTGDLNTALVGHEGDWSSLLPSGATIDFSEEGEIIPICWYGDTNMADMWPDIPALASDHPEMINETVLFTGLTSRGFFLPEGVPDATLEAARDMFEEVATDPEVDEQAPRPVEWTPGEEFTEQWEESLETALDVVDLLDEIYG